MPRIEYQPCLPVPRLSTEDLLAACSTNRRKTPETLFFSPETESTYPTGFGTLTFTELYAATDRIVGYTLREKLGMTNPEDIDDCMQAGYFKVWQLLQAQPDLFAGKPKKYVVQAVVLRSKVQRYAHLRHYRKVEFDAEAQDTRSLSFLTTHQIDTWIDLQQAVGTVGEQVARLDTTLYVLALYTLLTDVKTQDVAKLYRHGVSTLTAAKRQMRSALARELPGYGNPPELATQLPLARFNRCSSRPFSGELITLYLLTDEPPRKRGSTPTQLAPAPRPDLPSKRLLSCPSESCYPTRWRGTVTLEDLLTDEQVRKVAFAKARSLGYTGQDAEDCVQLGSINLWKALREQPTLLQDKGAAWVGVWIAFSGSRRALWKHAMRSVSLNDPELDWNVVDERLLGLRLQRSERWATWATRADERMDFALLIQTLAARYANDQHKLLALYALTTSVKMKDVAAIAGINTKRFAAVVGNKVKNDLRHLLSAEAENDLSDEYWITRLQHGELLDCVTRVAEQVQTDQRLLLALYVTTTSATRKEVATLFGLGLTTFRSDITQIKILLAQAYRQAKRE